MGGCRQNLHHISVASEPASHQRGVQCARNSVRRPKPDNCAFGPHSMHKAMLNNHFLLHPVNRGIMLVTKVGCCY